MFYSRFSPGEMPNIKSVECHDIPLGHRKCLLIEFSTIKEYAGLDEVKENENVFSGKLYATTDGTENTDSRVSLSFGDDGAYVIY